MITRLLIGKERTFYQHDKRAVDTQFGRVEADTINNAQDGAEALSNTHEKFVVLTPTFLDLYKKLERGPQIMMLKDLGYIAAETGLGPESIVGEAGTGTGAATIFFSRMVKHVYSFDIEQKHVDLGKRNAAALNATNITFEQRDIYESLPDHQYDLLLLDNPEPWKALQHYQTIKIGGWIVSYTPTIIQAAQFANSLPPEIRHDRTIELIERSWHTQGQKVRPSSDSVGHTAFLVFARRIQ